jgi:hypothetical protein
MFEQKRAASAAQLAHNCRRGESVAHAVADDQPDTPVL